MDVKKFNLVINIVEKSKCINIKKEYINVKNVFLL